MTDCSIQDAGPLARDLEALVAFDTSNPPRGEAEAARWVRARLAAAGCAAETVDLGGDRMNVVARFENGPGPVFAFNTHLDVVPAGAGWTTDPFSLRRRGDDLVGRGACDAKGPLASMIAAIEALVAARAQWSGALLGVFVADEEVASMGARAYAAGAPSVDFCMIGEPTSCRTVIAHKGSLRPVVHVRGQAAHSGAPDLGVNAILKCAPLFAAIAAEHARIAARRHPLVGSPSLTVTRCNAGQADNVVPDLCELLLDRRMIPGEDEAEVRQEIAAIVAQAAREAGVAMGVSGYRLTTGGASETPAGDPVVAAAQAACRRHLGRETPTGGFQGGCDLVHFRGIGAAGVILGPGDLSVAHKPDEHVPMGELVLAARIYRDTALAMLGG